MMLNRKSPISRIFWWTSGLFLRLFPDETALAVAYRIRTGRRLHLDPPVGFCEKIQWLKLHWRNPSLTLLSDKVRVRDFVERKIGPEYVIPTIGVWKSAADIEFSLLPDGYVLKGNHGSGMNVIVKPGRKPDAEKLRKKLAKWLKTDYSRRQGREWYYRDIPRRIVGEPYLADSEGNFWDYKFFCFNGEPSVVQVDMDRFGNMRRNFYDMEWKRVEMRVKYPNAGSDPSEPGNFGEMVRIARALAEDFPFVRIDLYNLDGKIYFGEMTFAPGSGFVLLDPRQRELEFGKKLVLPEPYGEAP